MAPINRAPFNALVDDSGNNLDGTIWNKAQIQAVLLDPIDAALLATEGVTTPNVRNIATTGDITALPLPTGKGPLTIRMDNPTLATIRGIAPGIPGQLLTILAVNVGQVDFTYGDAAAPVGNRMVTWVTQGRTSLYAGPGAGSSPAATFVYDGSARWMLVAHEQGTWITPPFAAANFAANNGGGWSVAAGHVSTCRYRVSGKTLSLALQINGALVVAPAPSVLWLYNGAWGGYLPAANQTNHAYVADPGGNPGIVQCNQSQNYLLISKTSAAGIATTTSYIQISMAFEIA